MARDFSEESNCEENFSSFNLNRGGFYRADRGSMRYVDKYVCADRKHKWRRGDLHFQ
jgi:hypothetical protein